MKRLLAILLCLLLAACGAAAPDAAATTAPVVTAALTAAPAEPTEETPEPAEITISCSILLDNMDKLDPEKAELVPDDGYILPTVILDMTGDTVFDALRAVTMLSGIHLDFSETAGMAYVKGIGNLYEFDAGERSGWIFKVNGEMAAVSASDYIIQPGDIIEWFYSLDWGDDV
jgi:hypothetical protein